MNTRFRTSLSALVVAGALAVPLAGVAAAEGDAPPTEAPAGARFDEAKARCLAAIDERLATLADLEGKVTSHEHVTDAHRAALLAEVTAASAGLSDLRPQIEAAADAATLRELCPKIVFDYRVYVLEVPTVHLTLGADKADFVVGRLTDASTLLADAIAAAQAAGKDVGDAPALLADLDAKVAQADDLAAPVADAVIPLVPADWNGGVAEPIVEGARNDLVQARDLLRGAIANARQIVEILGTA
ncbi:MAG: hypothetical protein M5U14_10785 [Acidimicrobiia bacterium]|nr:hypothetical protein [Acidimicrobiia bacterium]